MKKLRRRMALIFFFLIIISSIASISIAWMIQNDIIFHKKDIQYVLFGFALKDAILMLFALALISGLIFIFSRRTADPIAVLQDAAAAVSSGNFDIYVDESDRKDEIGKLQKQFNQMIRELQSNEYLKKDFISNVSHEFKTPLSIISGYANLLTEDHISDEVRKEYAALIVEESQRLSKLTGNILRLSKLNQDEIPIKFQYFSLDEQIRQCILLLEPKWSSKNLDFQLDLPEISFCGDEDLLSEVWINLLDNAVKFSPANETITMQIKKQPQSKYQITIHDNGCGMDEDTRSRVFEQFYQGDTSHKKEGNGLGLSIVAKVLELHHGQIQVESVPGSGTSFTILLPADQQ